MLPNQPCRYNRRPLQSYPQDASLLAFLATVHCQLCGADDNDEQLLLCDGARPLPGVTGLLQCSAVPGAGPLLRGSGKGAHVNARP
jgi:hypothetical protein